MSNANQQHGFPVPSHFQPALSDNMGGAPQPQPHNQMHRGAPTHGQRPEGIIDPSLEQNRLSGLEDDEQRHGAREEGKGNEQMDSSGNPDNLASLSAVAAAAAAASSQKPSS